MLGFEHYTTVDLVISLNDRFERGKHLLDTKIGEIAQTAVIYPKDEYVGVDDQPRRRYHCAVAAQDDDQIGIERQLVSGGDLTGGDRHARLSDAAFLQPLGKLRRRLAGLRVAGFYHNA